MSNRNLGFVALFCAVICFVMLILLVVTGPTAQGATVQRHHYISVQLDAYTHPESYWTEAGVALRWAESQRGHAYCYGGTGPCYDCSGLVMMAYRHAGVFLPRTTSEMQEDYPRIYRVVHPVPGDIILYGWPAYHAALYVGPGREFAASGYGQPLGFLSINWAPHAFYRVRWANTPR